MDRRTLWQHPLLLAFTIAGALALAPGAGRAQAPAAKPAASGGAASCRLEIAGNDMMQFDRKDLRTQSSCQSIEVVLKHVGKLPLAAMGHNWVLTATPDAQSVNNAGIAAGLKNDHVPAGDKRVLAMTRMIGGGETTSVRFPGAKLRAGGDYTFFCSFPGHFALMKGKLLVQ